MLNELVPYPCVAVTNQEGYLSCGGLPWEVMCPNLKSDSPTLIISDRKRCPHNIWLWRSLSVQVKWRAARVPAFLINGLHMDLLANRFTYSELHHWNRNSKITRDIWGENEVYGCRAMAGEAALSQLYCRQKPSFLCWAPSPPSLQLQVGTKLKSSSKSIHPNNSLEKPPAQPRHQPKYL